MTDSSAAGDSPRYVTIHIFNPETDFALASGSSFYNPPASVISLRRRLALTPARFASPGDALLLLDDDVPIPPGFRGDIVLLRLDGLARFILECAESVRPCRFRPWGWNRGLAEMLHRSLRALPSPFLPPIPSEDRLRKLRELSHRRLTIPFNRLLGVSDLPVELFSVEEALALLESVRWDSGELFLKAPWSSSGRGVLYTGIVSVRKIEEWVRGTVRRQGSVMGERARDKVLDCATEWELSDGEARFIGWSVFEASQTGRYGRNLLLPQEELLSRILALAPSLNPASLLDAQKEALDRLVAPDYSGPLGIDMLVDRSGELHPCIELNLRQTMGRVALEEYARRTSSHL